MIAGRINARLGCWRAMRMMIRWVPWGEMVVIVDVSDFCVAHTYGVQQETDMSDEEGERDRRTHLVVECQGQGMSHV